MNSNVIPFRVKDAYLRRRRIWTLREQLRNLYDQVLDPEERRDYESYIIERLQDEGAKP